MDTLAVVLEKTQAFVGPLSRSEGINRRRSFGGDRLEWDQYGALNVCCGTGRMPPFPGLGYPLVPGYESVGRVVDAGGAARSRIGETVFVPGSTGFKGARGLFGGAARMLVAQSPRVGLDP